MSGNGPLTARPGRGIRASMPYASATRGAPQCSHLARPFGVSPDDAGKDILIDPFWTGNPEAPRRLRGHARQDRLHRPDPRPRGSCRRCRQARPEARRDRGRDVRDLHASGRPGRDQDGADEHRRHGDEGRHRLLDGQRPAQLDDHQGRRADHHGRPGRLRHQDARAQCSTIMPATPRSSPTWR